MYALKNFAICCSMFKLRCQDESFHEPLKYHKQSEKALELEQLQDLKLLKFPMEKPFNYIQFLEVNTVTSLCVYVCAYVCVACL